MLYNFLQFLFTTHSLNDSSKVVNNFMDIITTNSLSKNIPMAITRLPYILVQYLKMFDKTKICLDS